jgi:adenylate kinase
MLKNIFVILPLMLSSLLLAQTSTQPASANAGPPLIILIGPPLSGKTTFVESIKTTYGIPAISVEDLIKDNAAELERLRGEKSLAEMRFDPAMSRYMRERLKTVDLSHGLALDGYPTTLVQAEDLAKLLPELKLSVIAFQLKVPDEVIRERAKKSGQQSNQPQILDQRIKDYHREMDSISSYFPDARLVSVNGNQSEAKVWKEIRAGMEGAGIKPAAK